MAGPAKIPPTESGNGKRGSNVMLWGEAIPSAYQTDLCGEKGEKKGGGGSGPPPPESATVYRLNFMREFKYNYEALALAML